MCLDFTKYIFRIRAGNDELLLERFEHSDDSHELFGFSEPHGDGDNLQLRRDCQYDQLKLSSHAEPGNDERELEGLLAERPKHSWSADCLLW